MEIIPAVGDAERLRTALLVIGVFSDRALSGSAKRVDDLASGHLSAALKQHGLSEAAGATLLLKEVPGLAAARVLLVSLGTSAGFSDRAYRSALEATGRILARSAVEEAVVALPEIEVPGRALTWRVQQAGQILADGSRFFRLPQAVSARDEAPAGYPRSVMLLIPSRLTAELVGALRRGIAVAEGMELARTIGNLAASDCTPELLGELALAMGSELGMDVQVFEPGEIEIDGAAPEAFVLFRRDAQASCNLIVLSSQGGRAKSRPIVLVGEAVPGEGMPRAASAANISGAACIMGAMRTVAKLGLPLNVVGIVAATKRRVVKAVALGETGLPAMAMQRREQPQARSDGKLLLGEMLTYAKRFRPNCVIDVAARRDERDTLPGSRDCRLFANDEHLAAELVRCSGRSGDHIRQVPLQDERATAGEAGGRNAEEAEIQLREPADEACFLSRYARSYPWAHLDIARARPAGGHAIDAAAPPVPLIAEFLLGRTHPANRE